MRTTVITNGCFDVLHAGHFALLMFCRNLATPEGKLVVLIDDDTKIKLDKGRDKPIFKAYERIQQLKAIELVNEIKVFYSNEDLNNRIKSYDADYLVKGSDWNGKRIIGSEHVKHVKFFEHPYLISSSMIIDRIKNPPMDWSLSKK